MKHLDEFQDAHHTLDIEMVRLRRAGGTENPEAKAAVSASIERLAHANGAIRAALSENYTEPVVRAADTVIDARFFALINGIDRATTVEELIEAVEGGP